MEKERFIDIKSCPYCTSDNYKSLNFDRNVDEIISNCECYNCGKKFKETFKLKCQNWNVS